MPRWRYDPDIRSCENFVYGGCGGNANNFEAIEACERKCIPREEEEKEETDNNRVFSWRDICNLSPSAGPCDNYQRRWHYDSITRECKEFSYGGCLGNHNNFESRDQCMTYCDSSRWSRPRPTTEAPEIVTEGSGEVEETLTGIDVCRLDLDSGSCRFMTRQWHYDRSTGQCNEFVYGGCDGNENRFPSRDACEQQCNPRDREGHVLFQMSSAVREGHVIFQMYSADREGHVLYQMSSADREVHVLFQMSSADRDDHVLFQMSSADWEDHVLFQMSSADREDHVLFQMSSADWEDHVLFQMSSADREDHVLFQMSSADREDHVLFQMSSADREVHVLFQMSSADRDDHVLFQMSSADWEDHVLFQMSSTDWEDHVLFQMSSADWEDHVLFQMSSADWEDHVLFQMSSADWEDHVLFQMSSADWEDHVLFQMSSAVWECHVLFQMSSADWEVHVLCWVSSADREVHVPFLEECDCEWYESCADKGKCVCPEICTLELVPVCGRNRTSDEHKTYGNICGLKSEACRSDGEIEYKSDGDCEDPRVKSGFCPARTDWGGLLGACAPSCQTDKDCQTDQKCCHQGCGYKCVNPVDEEPYQMRAPVRVSVRPEDSKSVYLTWTDSNLGSEQPTQDRRYYTVRFYSYELGQYNYQNVTDMRTRIEGLRPGTTYQFSVRVNNPPYLSEWSEDVEAITGVDGPGVKSGFCPARTDWGGLLGACAPSCQADKDCPTDQKCCHHGCGYKCVNPVDEEPYQMRAPVRVSVRPEDSKSVYLTWTDSNLGSEQLIRDRRYYTVRFYSYELGQYNYQNVTDMRTRIEGLRPGTTYQFSVRVNNPPYLSEWSEDVEAITGVDVISKPGSCPALDEDNFGICVEECQSDSDCGGPRKCCDNGCGHTCSHPQGYDVCSLMKDPGTCGNWTVRWFFDLEDGACDRFWYGQCGGNENNFLTQGECEAKCGSGEVTTARPRPTVNPRDCRYSAYGCCDDNYTAKQNAQGTNCREYRPPVIPGPSGETVVPVTPGENAILRCKYDGDIAWYRDGKLVTSDERRSLSDGELQVFGANIEDDGMYACHVTSRSGLRIYRYMLQVQVPIGILPGPDIIMVKPNNLAFLHCEVYGNPKPTVSWKKAGETLPTSYRYETFSNGTLLIRNASPEDVDSYTCMADNGVSTPVDRTFKLSLRVTIVVIKTNH
ncbi:TFPI1-like protein [Mya arenaria]|uniref:TFPI1-like protein n=1 Tax=Mya arenaria TaxID=6604 RepID=A0ABY7FD29_MYAAR|nr:TFPI1-like protein [Mya arenaria]